MICSTNKCLKDAVTFHGVTTITHGYCYEHRCCAACGGRINPDENSTRCRCRVPTERPEVLQAAGYEKP